MPILIINIRTIVSTILEFILYNDVQYNNKSIYNYKWLPIKNTYSMLKKLHVIYEHGGIDAIYNLLEIYNQTYLIGNYENDSQGLTSVLFIYYQKGDLQNYNYNCAYKKSRRHVKVKIETSSDIWGQVGT